MMDNKLNLSDLYQELADKTGQTKATAELFAKAFFSQIEEGLRQDGMVKIHGFGTFKAQWNEPRKSVNINTGEDIVIPGHTRVTFTPEQEIKDRINEPFSYLQPTPIGEVPIAEQEDTEPSTPLTDLHAQETESVGDTLQKLNNDADEIKALLCDINGTDWMNSSSPVQDIAIEEQPEPNTPVESIPLQEMEITPETPSTPHTPVDAPADTPLPTPPTTEVSSAPVHTVSTSHTVSQTEPTTPQPITSHTSTWKKVLIGVVATLCIILVGGYFYITHRIEQWAERKIEAATLQADATLNLPQSTPETEVIMDTILTTDTTPIVTEEATAEVAPLPTQTLQPPTVYQDFIDTVQLTAGSRLAWLSKKYYGSAFFWVYIYEANKQHLSNPNDIPVGTTIKIPQLPHELINPADTNCINLAKEIQINILNNIN